jgi:uncharacterized protein YutE (UPF0331/DUF86 family)
MIDLEKINDRIAVIRENLDELREMRKLPLEAFRSNRRDVAAAKYFLRSAIEAVHDIGSHILAKQKWGPPSGYADVMIKLQKHGVVTEQSLPEYVKMIKYRNRLVHFYHEVTVEELHEIILTKLGDFDRFIGEVIGWLEGGKDKR